MPCFPYAEVFIPELISSCCTRDSSVQSNREYICLPLTKSRWEKLWAHKPQSICMLEGLARNSYRTERDMELKKQEQSRLLQGTAAIWHFLQQEWLQANSSWGRIFLKALSLFLKLSNQLQLRDFFLLAWSSSVSSILLLSGWQSRQKIQDRQGKRMVWKVVDPWGIAVSPSWSKQLCCVLLLQISIKTNTEMTTDNINCASGHPKSRIFSPWASEMPRSWRACGITLNHLAVRHLFQQWFKVN